MDLKTFEEEVNRSPFAEGQDYSSLKELKLTVQTWAIKETFEFKTLRATKTRWEVRCKGVGGELSGVFRSADCAVPWDIRKGRTRGLLSSMLRDTKERF